MSRIHSQYQLQVPATLRNQLLDFRRRVWTTKMTEAVGVAIFTVAFIFLCVFALDRLWDTPVWMRWTAFILAVAGCMVAPFYWHRWVWRHRALENLARLLSRKLPRVGDRLLGIIELAHSESEQARLRRLCEAAIEQVAQDAVKRDFRAAAPETRHKLWSALSAVCVVAAVSLFVLFPDAAFSSMHRFVAPWSDTPRYTFTAIETLPSTLVVPHGEPFMLVAKLSEHSKWHPDAGMAELPGLEPIKAELADGAYTFQLPAQIESNPLRLSIGDWTQTIRTEPMLRPELTSLVAQISLPEYLGRPEPQKADVRGGAISLVKGSRAIFSATISRNLSGAQLTTKPASQTARSSPRLKLRSRNRNNWRSPGKMNSDWPEKIRSTWPSMFAMMNHRLWLSRICRVLKWCSTRSNWRSK